MAIKDKKKGGKAAGIGLGRENQVVGGGLYDDFDGQILDISFVEWDYNGSIDEPVLALAVEIQNEDEEEAENKNPFIQYYSAGALKHFVPSEDGEEAVPVGSKTGLSENCNAVQFINSMLDADESGELEKELGTSVAVFKEKRFHFKRQEQEERKGLKKKKDEDDEDKRPKTILLAETLLEGAAGGKKKAAGAGKDKTATKASTSKAGGKPDKKKKVEHDVDEDVAEQAYLYIAQQLQSEGDGISADDLAANVFAWAKKNKIDPKMRNKVVEAIGDEDFLSADNDVFEFDGSELTAKD